MGMTYDRDPFKGLCYFVLEGRNPYVRVGKRSRAMDFAILRDGTILGAFATEKDAANYVKRGEQIDRLKAELRETQERLERCREEEAMRCIKDVCMYCDGRAPGYEPAEGPNSAANWTHRGKNQKPVLCPASSIWSRITYRAALRDTEER